MPRVRSAFVRANARSKWRRSVEPGERRHLVDDHIGLGPRHRLADRTRVEAVHHHGLRAERTQAAGLVGLPGRRHDIVAVLDQSGDEESADRASCTCNENTHWRAPFRLVVPKTW